MVVQLCVLEQSIPTTCVYGCDMQSEDLYGLLFVCDLCYLACVPMIVTMILLDRSKSKSHCHRIIQCKHDKQCCIGLFWLELIFFFTRPMCFQKVNLQCNTVSCNMHGTRAL